jgi:hypothetical protein
LFRDLIEGVKKMLNVCVDMAEEKDNYGGRVFKSVANAMDEVIGKQSGRFGVKGLILSAAYTMFLMASEEQRSRVVQALQKADWELGGQGEDHSVFVDALEILGVNSPPSDHQNVQPVDPLERAALAELKKADDPVRKPSATQRPSHPHGRRRS